MSRHRSWPKAKRAEAERLADEVGIDEAATRLGLPRGTVVSWVSRTRKAEAAAAERSELERQAAEVEAELQVELTAPKDLDELGQVEWLEKNLEGASAKLTIALAGGRASDARNYATVVGILTDKLKAVRAEVAARGEKRRFVGDPREAVGRLMYELGGRRLEKSSPAELEAWAAEHAKAAAWLTGEAGRRRAGEPPSVDQHTVRAQRGLTELQRQDSASFVAAGSTLEAARESLQSDLVDDELGRMAAELEDRGLGGEVERAQIVEEAKSHVEHLVSEGVDQPRGEVPTVDGPEPSVEEELGGEGAEVVDLNRAYRRARAEAMREWMGGRPGPWDGDIA